MKKLTLTLIFVFASAFASFAQEESQDLSAISINRSELENTAEQAVQFENFGGPYAIIETAAAIKGIGENLGRIVARDIFSQGVIEPLAKYTLIHAVNPNDTEKLSADILVLNENAGVDHINNLRRILSGYLEQAYGYSEEESATLSVFITVYNAVYRGDMNNFTEKYNDVVLQYLSPEKAGLSTNWEEWKGNSQIVIPLGTLSETVSSVDTTTISDDNVIEALRTTEDKGIEDREQLTEIKQKEAAAASENAKQSQKEAAQQKKDGNKEQAQASAQKSSEQQKIADRKTEEIKKEKAEIEKDKKELAAEVPADYLTGLFISDEKNGFYQLVTVDSSTGKIIRKSPVSQIRSKAVYTVDSVTITNLENEIKTYPQLYMAVCGTNDKHSAVRLCLIDTEKLELQKQSEEILSESAELILTGAGFITVVQDEKNYRIALYDKNLSVTARSQETVKEKTPLNMTQKGLLVTAENGSPLLLDPKTLSSLWNKGNTNVHNAGNEK